MTEWQDIKLLPARAYICYKCNKNVAPDRGYTSKDGFRFVYLCPLCDLPTLFEGGQQIPSPAFGQPVEHLPDDVEGIYNEARQCTSAGAFTAAVLACRKLLMHIAVEREAKKNQSFAYYVDYLADNHFVPPDSKAWVERIRTKGNEANHEIVSMSQQDAEDLLIFLAMLLKFIYEFPGKLSPPSEAG